ncbi:hypothetical protein B0I10_1195 [Flavobacterium lacus]|uniref:Uncharacterized protein n=1 Tax=Flavobacterium lacus TaxID=1353778 RepID=A0A328WMT3_9FLAO|nr:hypothetical protein B0I10_1195 [Flavobacterium lacus]
MQILNILSLIATFAVAQVLFYLIFKITFNKVQIFNTQILLRIKLKHILSFTISTLLLMKYTTFYIPF